MIDQERRRFLEFLGYGSASLAWIAGGGSFLSACSTMAPSRARSPIPGDELELVRGLSYQTLIGQGDEIAPGLRFGDCNDYLAVLPAKGSPDQFFLWANHEYTLPVFITGRAKTKGQKRDKSEVDRELKEVGASLVRIQRQGNEWKVLTGAPGTRRLDGHTEIPFAAGKKVWGSTKALGTMANCSGGVTPWGSFLSCEENYEEFIGERIYENGKPKELSTSNCLYGWESVIDSRERPPEHQGWVVESDPVTGLSRKLVSLGRFAHETATVVQGKDGRCAVYMGDDGQDRCLYKFVASKAGSLEEGTLYVARLEDGQWLPLTRDSHPLLKKNFATETDVLMRARLSGYLAGGSMLDRPEGIAIDPMTGAVFIALTNNAGAGRPHGSILKLEETGGDPLSLTFRAATFLPGGPASGFSCPDNLAFDASGNLWIVSDISGGSVGKPPYEAFERNGLFVVPTRGSQAGKVTRLALGPMNAELTGLCFAPGGRELFLSVQHPGELTTDPSRPTSHWGAKSDRGTPRSCVVTISGPLLEEIVAGS